MDATYYAVVTWGWAANRPASFYRSLPRAQAAARAAKGTGTCTDAQVHACTSAAQAKSADIGALREGESIVFAI